MLEKLLQQPEISCCFIVGTALICCLVDFDLTRTDLGRAAARAALEDRKVEYCFIVCHAVYDQWRHSYFISDSGLPTLMSHFSFGIANQFCWTQSVAMNLDVFLVLLFVSCMAYGILSGNLITGTLEQRNLTVGIGVCETHQEVRLHPVRVVASLCVGMGSG